MSQKQTIQELLKSMLTINDSNDRNLENNKETWSRIANKDNFSELGFNSDSEKEKFLKEWIEQNPYNL